MILTIVIAFVSLIALIVIHELGHFILAKKFGVKVEEFGIGYPPKIIGKKIGETIYSLNLLPFGAFVRILGEEKTVDSIASFRNKPIWQRALIILGGVVSFWIVGAILLSIVMNLGVPTIIEDDAKGPLINPQVQIISISPDSPAELANLRVGDSITNIACEADSIPTTVKISTVKDVQDATDICKGGEAALTIQRGKEVFEVTLTPRASPPNDQGPIGVALVRTALEKHPWYEAPIKGITATWNLSIVVIKGLANALINAITGKPTGVKIMGPVGIFDLLNQASQLGVIYFLQFIAIISIHLAWFNLLPIPAVDGGRLLFLAIEKLRGRPIKDDIEMKINGAFFLLIIALMIWVTIKDIIRIF